MRDARTPRRVPTGKVEEGRALLHSAALCVALQLQLLKVCRREMAIPGGVVVCCCVAIQVTPHCQRLVRLFYSRLFAFRREKERDTHARTHARTCRGCLVLVLVGIKDLRLLCKMKLPGGHEVAEDRGSRD